jgi:hypothetical protein
MPEMNEQNRRQVLAEVVKQFGRKEWFRDASVYNHHPTDGLPTLEFKVNYIPIFERKDVKEFASSVGLSERFIVVDRSGKPVE